MILLQQFARITTPHPSSLVAVTTATNCGNYHRHCRYARTMSPRPTRALPADLCVDWPERSSVDPIAERARQLALNLREAIGQRSVREIASITGVDRATIGAVLQGKSWPDIVTLAKLEHELGSLWPAT
jgi:hypothetical protein